jgi:YD repeat-containing protein
MKFAALLALAVLLPAIAIAQQRTIYGADGKVTGRVATDRQGSTTIYDASGRVVGRTSTDSQGTTTLYDANGRRAGSVTANKSK